jgi:DNA-directed RNA polymerase specialized sigma24 family protein
MLHATGVEDTVKLVLRTLSGDADAWQALQVAVEPTILRMARRHRDLRRKGLAGLADDLAEIRTAALERLARSNFGNLRSFVERQAPGEAPSPESFEAWLYGVVDFVIREHLRKRFGRAPKLSDTPASGPRPSKRDLQSHAGRLDDQPERSLLNSVSVTTRLTLAQIFEYIDAEFTPLEVQAVRLYFMEDKSFDEIAHVLELEHGVGAERLIRRLNARLRYRFLDRTQESTAR